MNNIPGLVGSNWDRAYNDGKYDHEGPVPFVTSIVDLIKKEGLENGLGFYPGCGNGRNLIPLLDAGLHIEAQDISEVAVRQLQDKRQGVKVEVGDFMSSSGLSQYDYVLSIQLFQHVNEHGPRPLFEKVLEVLKPGGLFILRVNSINTQIAEDYTEVETSDVGGLTIQYESGHKNGQFIHFYSAEQIHDLTRGSFNIVVPLREERIPREDGTFWAQWETILRKD